MINKYTSIKRVISKVFTDLDLKEEPHRVSDMIEWGAEALEKIGAFPYFINKVTGRDDIPMIQLVDYQAQLPMDLHRVIQVAYAKQPDGPFYPMRSGTGNFDYSPKKNDIDQVSDLEVGDNEVVTLAMQLYNLSYADALNKINTEPTTKSTLQALLTSTTTSRSNAGGGIIETIDYTYVITNGYIKTNMKDGYLMMAYQAIPTDIDGYPLVPDDQSFIEALYWYIVMKSLYPEWMSGRIRDAVYFEARRSWSYYCKQAYGNALMPTQDELESIKNSWLRLIPQINEHDTFFTTLGERQRIYNQNQINYHPYYYAQIR